MFNFLVLSKLWLAIVKQDRMMIWTRRIILIYFVRGSISVQLTSCFICLDSAPLLMLNYQQIYHGA